MLIRVLTIRAKQSQQMWNMTILEPTVYVSMRAMGFKGRRPSRATWGPHPGCWAWQRRWASSHPGFGAWRQHHASREDRRTPCAHSQQRNAAGCSCSYPKHPLLHRPQEGLGHTSTGTQKHQITYHYYHCWYLTWSNKEKDVVPTFQMHFTTSFYIVLCLRNHDRLIDFYCLSSMNIFKSK